MRVLGMISGTSHDGIDAALVELDLREEVLHGAVLHTATMPYEADLRNHLLRTLPPAELRFVDVCRLDTLIGQAFAEVAAAAIARAGPVDLICSHGQTVYHWVDGQRALGTLQLGQPAWIAERTGVPVVADVRIRDITAGGQGAPLVSQMDTLLLADLPGNPAALNLGGIANMTVLRGPRGPFAYDIGPANALIDAAVVSSGGGTLGYDEDGRLAAAGRIDAGLLAELLREPFYALPAPKTTGKELFNAAYLQAALARRSGLRTPDLVATVTALTAETVAAEVRRHGVDGLVVSGGGCANPTLMAMLRERLPGVTVRPSTELGAPTDAKEAIAFALIGWHTVHGLSSVVPGCTGARAARILGAIVPGAGPLRLPEPLARPPRALRLSPSSTDG
ncbi:MAG: anhydro-N-acetylmuramic acid kinase [Anaerolinea sp.]|nr:anhydro-N-acetylmuramic acid kinase [Anaerolinea sp.]